MVEQNTSLFTVRRSVDNSTWTTIGILPAAVNSLSTLSYSFIDTQALAGTAYYQIVHEGLDKRQTYSPVLTGNCAQPEGIKVYPNPTKNNCWVSIQTQTNQTVSMHLYNAKGALLQQQALGVQSGNNLLELSLANYPGGVYLLAFTWSDGRVKVIRVEKI